MKDDITTFFKDHFKDIKVKYVIIYTQNIAFLWESVVEHRVIVIDFKSLTNYWRCLCIFSLKKLSFYWRIRLVVKLWHWLNLRNLIYIFCLLLLSSLFSLITLTLILSFRRYYIHNRLFWMKFLIFYIIWYTIFISYLV